MAAVSAGRPALSVSEGRAGRAGRVRWPARFTRIQAGPAVRARDSPRSGTRRRHDRERYRPHERLVRGRLPVLRATALADGAAIRRRSPRSDGKSDALGRRDPADGAGPFPLFGY